MIDLTGFVDAWLATLWRASWQGGLLFLVVWSLCRWLLSMPARIQSWLWRLVVLKFVVAIVSKLGTGRLLPTMSVGTAGSQESLKQRLVAMKFIKPASAGWIVSCGLLLSAVGVLGIVPWKAVAAEPSQAIERLLEADDFWSKTGASLTHETVTTRQDSNALRMLAGHADNATVRIRAYKLLADFNGRTRYSRDIPEQECLEAVEAVFRHLEKHLDDKVVSKFRPELGFTHVGLSRRGGDAGVWVLIEATDSLLPSGGLNIQWNSAAKAVGQIEHWGASRNPTLLTATASQTPAKPVEVQPAAKAAPEPAGDTTKQLEEKLKAQDFWAKIGNKKDHPELVKPLGPTIGPELTGQLKTLAGNSSDVAVRIRAYKLLADLLGRCRIAPALDPAEAEDAVEGAFTYLEANLKEAAVQKFRPQLGFTHVTVSAGDENGTVWVLIENTTVDAAALSSGINLRWNPKTKKVDQIKHWGSDRGL